MKMTIEIESLDDLINLVGMINVMQNRDKKEEPKAEPQPAPKGRDFAAEAQVVRDLNERRRVMFLHQPIESLELWPPAVQSLKENGIYKVEHLLSFTATDLRDMNNVGTYTIRAIKDRLSEHKLSLGGHEWSLMKNR